MLENYHEVKNLDAEFRTIESHGQSTVTAAITILLLVSFAWQMLQLFFSLITF